MPRTRRVRAAPAPDAPPDRTHAITNKPDPDKTREDFKDRQFLAEIKDGTTVIDAAYFPTKAAAEAWAWTVYRMR